MFFFKERRIIYIRVFYFYVKTNFGFVHSAEVGTKLFIFFFTIKILMCDLFLIFVKYK